MRLFLGLFILTLTPAHAELSQGTFQLHIKPQLVGIFQDFRQVLISLPDYPREMLALQDLMQKQTDNARSLERICPQRPTIDCQQTLQEMLDGLHSMEKLFLTFQGHPHYPMAIGLSPFSGLRLWMSFEKSRARLESMIQVELLSLGAGNSKARPWSTDDIILIVDHLSALQDLLIVEFIPPRYQDDFRSAWSNFFRPLHHQAEKAGNRQYLMKNKEALNFYWNLLNMRMTKRLKLLPEGMQQPLNAIQNRWNQVMRISNGQ